MFHSLSVQSGFAKSLIPKKLEFKQGLNILFGPNACGKTTTLKILAAHSSCEQGGWTNVPLPPLPSFCSTVSSKIDWFKVFQSNTPANCKVKVSWDGTPTFLFMPDHNPSAFSVLGETDGIIDETDQILEFTEKLSAGQRIIFRLKKLSQVLKSMPTFAQTPEVIPTMEGYRQYKGCNSLYQDNADQFTQFMNSFKDKSNIPTILMDEPDKSLAIPDACLLWEKVIPWLAERHQLIIATHCPFALLSKNAHWVTMGSTVSTVSTHAPQGANYLDKCKEAVAKFKVS